MVDEVKKIEAPELIRMYQQAAKTNQVLNDAYDKVSFDNRGLKDRVAKLEDKIIELEKIIDMKEQAKPKSTQIKALKAKK